MMNPLSTGSEMNDARKPSRSRPAAIATRPVASASAVVNPTTSPGFDDTVATTPIDSAAVADIGGITGRDALWAHPDLLPSAEDLDDPAGFVARTAAGAPAETDWDAGLRDLDKDLDGTLDDDASGGPAES